MRQKFHFYAGELIPVGSESFTLDANLKDISLESQLKINFVTEAVLLDAQECVLACENCDDTAEITFDYLLDAVTGCDATTTEHLMCRVAKCPQCYRAITENTRVVPV